jgi:hypothetical protein
MHQEHRRSHSGTTGKNLGFGMSVVAEMTLLDPNLVGIDFSYKLKVEVKLQIFYVWN